jgi:hypothetical protein
MTLRDTELIGKKLVKYGFYRSNADHQYYRGNIFGGVVTIHFRRQGTAWNTLITHEIDTHTTVHFTDHQAVFTPQWVAEEHKKLQAMFKFLRV